MFYVKWGFYLVVFAIVRIQSLLICSGYRLVRAVATGNRLCLVASAWIVAQYKLDEAWDACLRQITVADVFSRECGLMHVSPHIAGVDPIGVELGVFGRKDGAQMRQCRFRRSIATPTRIGFNRRIACDVDNRRIRSQQIVNRLHHAEWGDQVDLVNE